MRPTHRPFTAPCARAGAVLALAVTALAGCSTDTGAAPVQTATAPMQGLPTTAPPTASPTPSQPATPSTTPSIAPTVTPSVPGAEPTHGALTVTVTFSQWDATAGAAEIGGYVTGVIESDGTCTLVLTSGSETVREAVSAVPDVSTTSCGTLSVARARLHPGSWTAHLTYTSHSGSGTSNAVSIEVP